MKKITLILLVLSIVVAFASCGNDEKDKPAADNTPPTTDTPSEDIKPEEIKYSEGLEFVSRGEGMCSLKSVGSCKDADIIVPLKSPAGEKVTSIDASAFEDVTFIVSITIPADVTQIGHYAFKGCTSLTKVTYAEDSKLSEIGYDAFSGCKALFEMHIPAEVLKIGNAAFKNCTALDNVTFAEGSVLEGIAFETFRGCTALRFVAVPDGITEIGESAFRNCYSLEKMILPEGVVSIGNSAFANCEKFEKVSLPSTFTTLGDKAFSGCKSLKNISVAEGNPVHKSINGNLYSADGQTLVLYAMGKSDKIFEIPAGVTTLAPYSFAYGSSLTEVIIPVGVTTIGDHAFLGCSSLKSVVIPSGLRTIGASAFYNCNDLASVSISQDVSSIGNMAFYNCPSLSEIKVAAGNTRYKDVDGNLYSYNGKELIQYASGKTDTTFVVPSGVTTINNYALAYCKSLSSVSIPASVTKIGKGTFMNSESLTDIYFAGTESQWAAIGLTSTDVNNATVHFNSAM